MLTLVSPSITETGGSFVPQSRLLALYERARADLGLTDAEVMRAAGLPNSWISEHRGERGFQRRRPTPETLKKLARALKVPYKVVALAAAEDFYDVEIVREDDRYIVWSSALDDVPPARREEIIRRAIEELQEWQDDKDS